MTKNYEELFQDRVDELLLLEQRADRRKVLDDLLGKVGDIDTRFAKMNAASDQVRDYVVQSAQHALRTAKLFLGTVIACALFVAGTLWWFHHIMNKLTPNKADLTALDIKLKHTPVIVNFKGKDYVRIIPNSETGFTRNDGSAVPGKYSEVWHAR